jgi:hypothetical protein
VASENRTSESGTNDRNGNLMFILPGSMKKIGGIVVKNGNHEVMPVLELKSSVPWQDGYPCRATMKI